MYLTANSSLPESSEDEAEPPVASGRNSPESLAEDPGAIATRLSTLNPSPYYYSDLLAKNQQQQAQLQLHPQASQSVRDEPIYAIRYKQPNTLDPPRPPKKKVYSQKRYSVVEEGVHIIKCETPSTSSTSDDSNCTECRQRREQDYHDHQQHHQEHQQQQHEHSHPGYQLQFGQRSNSADYVNELQHDDDDNNDTRHHHNLLQPQQQQQLHHRHHQRHHHPHSFGHPMPPHRLLDPTLCACSGSNAGTGTGDDFQEIFRPRSIFYVHDDNENGCADCCLSHSDSGATGGGTTSNTNTTTNLSTARGRSRDRPATTTSGGNGGSMRNGRCGLYETAFDSKVGRSDDDLEELSHKQRINSGELLNEAGAGAVATAATGAVAKHSGHKGRAKHGGLRLKSSHSTDSQEFEHVRRPTHSSRHHLSARAVAGHRNDNDAAQLAQDFEQIQINAILNGDPLNASSATNLPGASSAASAAPIAAGTGGAISRFQQLQMHPTPPSPPSTAPLPLKFPHHHHHQHHHHGGGSGGVHHVQPSDGLFGVGSAPNNNQSAPDLQHQNSRQHSGLSGMDGAVGGALSLAGTSGGATASAALAAFATPPAQQHSRLRQLRMHHHSTSGEQQTTGGSSATLHSDSSSMTGVGGAIGGAPVRHSVPVRPQRSHHKERPQSMHAAMGGGGADKKPPPSLKNKRCQLREHIRLKTNYSSTESMNTSSSGGSMESLRSSNSEGNRSTTSYESRHSTSLSSHSSDSGSRALYPLRAAALIHSKMHILSPISDKSSLEHTAEMAERDSLSGASALAVAADSNKAAAVSTARRLFMPAHRTHLLLAGTEEMQGSDSGISLQSTRGDTASGAAAGKSKSAFQPFSGSLAAREKLSLGGNNAAATGSGTATTSGLMSLADDIGSLPFDMPKLIRRRQQLLAEQKQCTSDSATSVDLGDLPFDMPKLKRRLRQTTANAAPAAGNSQTMTAIGGLAFPLNPALAHLMPGGGGGGGHTSTESSGLSHASSSQSMRDNDKLSGMWCTYDT